MQNATKIRNKVTKEKKEFAKQLRKNLTPAEQKLWKNRSKINGKVRRQAIVLGWIIDFYIPRKFLAIEIDGSIHDNQKEQDALRDEILFNKRKIYTIRFPNQEIFSDIKSVIAQINLAISEIESSRK